MSSGIEGVGESGGWAASVILDSEYVRSKDWARFWSVRGLENFSFNLASSSESEPLL